MSLLRWGRRLRSSAVAGVAAVVGAGSVILAGPSMVGAAEDQDDHVHPETGDHYHAADLDGDGRFTGQGEVWPPRPDGAGEPTRLDVPAVADRSTESPLARQVAVGAEVADLLGDRWTVLEVTERVKNGKGQPQGGKSQISYFSRSNNQTVQVDLTGGRVQSIKTIDPTEAQLPVTPGESEDAVAIARQHWLDQGFDRIDDLEGFVILAFTPGQTHFGVRMVYVSFHTDHDARPEFVNWVDLSNESVSFAREEAWS